SLPDRCTQRCIPFTFTTLFRSAAQNAGLSVLGYTTQAHFLMNCGLLGQLHGADAPTTAAAQKLLTEHEMGELFKVVGLGARGFRDRKSTRLNSSHQITSYAVFC